MVEFWGSGHGSHERAKDKLEKVVVWLAWFDYSDRRTLATMLGVKERGQGAFYKRLEESGFVRAEKAPGIGHTLYSLGDAGFDLAKMLEPNLELKRRRRLPAWITLVHSLSIQIAVIKRLPQLTRFHPEKALKHLRAVRLPDAILELTSGEKVAVEVELQHKSTARVYHIYLAHLRNLRNGHYDRVLYLFPNDALARLYAEKFNQPMWPIYRVNEARRLALDASRQFDASKVQNSGLIEFETEDLYKL